MANLVTLTITQKFRRTYDGVAYTMNTRRIKQPQAVSTACDFFYLEKHDRRDPMIPYRVSNTYASVIASVEDAEPGKVIAVNTLYKGRGISNIVSWAATEFWHVDDIVYCWANPSNANQTYVQLETSNFKIIY